MLDIFTSMPALSSLLTMFISLLGPILILGIILWSIRPTLTQVGLSASPQGMLSIPALFLAGPEHKVLLFCCHRLLHECRLSLNAHTSSPGESFGVAWRLRQSPELPTAFRL